MTISIEEKGATNNLALRLTSSGAGWGSGIQFENTNASGKSYGIYSSSTGLFYIDTLGGGVGITVDNNSNVGIGDITHASYKLYVSGNAYSTSSFIDGSDISLKRNIHPSAHSILKRCLSSENSPSRTMATDIF